MKQEPAMPVEDVVELYTTLGKMGINIWIGGGWGIDALLGEQTRPHGDLDITMQEKDLKAVCQILKERGYKDVARDDTCAWNFVLGDDKGREIDFHVIVFDADGNGVYGPAERGVNWPAASLTGTGEIGGIAVKCISAEYQVKFHTGYKLRPNDFKDVSALCQRFGIEYPPEYVSLKKPAPAPLMPKT
jgi:lincosamide nucleotidyltransferase A/C/D/E